MKSPKNGKSTSNKAEVVGITPFGLWLLINDMEYYMPYAEYPWFNEATVKDIYDVQLLFSNHLRWEKLDIDLELESLNHLVQYPLKYIK